MHAILRKRCGSLATATLCALSTLAPPPNTPGQEYEGRQLVQATLVADTDAVAPGMTFRVGLLLEQAPGWHTYWQYPGDSGMATRIDWQLPVGFEAGSIQWPLPVHLTEGGGLEVYAYKNRTLLITRITAPQPLANESVHIHAKASWLVCEAVCIPGNAEVSLTLPVTDNARPANTELFDSFSSSLPRPADNAPFDFLWQVGDGQSTLHVTGSAPSSAPPEFFPLPMDDQVIGHPVVESGKPGSFTIRIPILSGPERPVPGILVTENPAGERNGWRINPGGENTKAGISNKSAQSGPSDSTTPANPPGGGHLALFLFYGFLGGLILNLMPCVLPVVSLKVFGFISQANEEPTKILRHGIAFSSGIFAWFLGLAAVVASLKAAGNEVNWAFQFQNPFFLFTICCLLVVFALNLFGVFEFQLPASANSRFLEWTRKDGYGGSFFHGVLATILATPCTAPFLGTALGFAFAQPSHVIFAMFAAIALGMAAPYLALAARPGWMRFLPKPGSWMNTFKQFLGFVLLATLLWLLWVIGNQGGNAAVISASAFFLVLGMVCWLAGHYWHPGSSRRAKTLSAIAATALVAGGWYMFVAGGFQNAIASGPDRNASSPPHNNNGIAWIPFSEEQIQKELRNGRPVFVDFTADWCLTCKFNERTAINTSKVRNALKRKNVVPMKADWTNSDPKISAFLKRHNRAGVPFYLLYHPDTPNSPQSLPELLTENIMLNALASLPEKSSY